MQGKLYYSAQEVQVMLGVSRGKAYKIIKELNKELEEKGFIVIAGKIPIKFFSEHFYGLALQTTEEVAPQPATTIL